LRLLDPAAMLASEAQALNRTRNNLQTAAIELVADEMGIPKAKLAKRGRRVSVALSKSGSKAGKFGAVSKGRNATRRRLETSVRAFGRPFNVGRWDGQEVREGASTSLSGRKRKGKGRAVGTTHSAYGRRQFAPGTWRLKNGAIVKRHGKSFRGVYGPGVAQVMEYPHIRRKLDALALKQFDRHFSAAVAFRFSSAGQALSGGRSSRR
jgi:hypothetical protein